MMKVEAAVMKFWRIVVLGFVGVIIFSRTLNAGIGDWKNYTDMKSVRAVASDGRYIWAGTSGGLFRFDPTDSSFIKFSNSEGLSSNNVTALTVDAKGNVWIGQSNGSIDVYTPSINAWRYSTDIFISPKNNKAINSLVAKGDSIFIATAFGVAVFSISKFEFRETYSKFATLSQPSVTAVQLYKNRIIAVTDKGIVISKLNAVNLAAPESWDIISSITTGNSVVISNDSLFIGTTLGILKFENNSFINATGVFPTRVLFFNDGLYFTDGRIVYSRSSTQIITQISEPSKFEITSGCKNSLQKIFIGFGNNGIGTFGVPPSAWKYFFPNGPASNSFSSIVIDNNGILWCASGREYGSGFYSYNGNQWINYSTATSSLVKSNDCFAIGLGPNNSKWISTWGSGLILVNSQGTVVRNFDFNYPGFIGISKDDQYIVPSRIAIDDSNNVWTSIYITTSALKTLWKMSPDSVWTPYSANSASYSSMLKVFIDRNDTKWFTNRVLGHPATAGAVFYNEKNSIPGTTKGWGEIFESDGLTSSAIYDMAEDKQGDIWFATESGISIIGEPQNPRSRVTKIFNFAVRDQQLLCIAIDPLNNKWIGTKRGVVVLSPDGSTILQQYSVESTNGKLVDNTVVSIAFDTKKGIVYFGTEQGLSSLEIPAIQISSNLKNLVVNPNPVYLDKTPQVELRGLVDESIIKVLTINGKLIKQFSAQGGGRAFWDCRDATGLLVASGIYFLVAHSPTGDQVGTAKVAVIHR